MKTVVILDGVMGKKFGKRWELYINSPAEALRIIAANRPDLPFWIRDHLETYAHYKVTCEYENGVTEIIGEEQLTMLGKLKKIRFTPIVAGAGGNSGIFQIIAGVVLIVAAIFTWGATLAPALAMMGAGMVIGGVAGMLTSQPNLNPGDSGQRSDKTSYYFDGPVNTSQQGVAVSLIYGKKVKAGSAPVSASLTVDDEEI
ncbi:MAG: hypothetical protein ACXWXL_03365 [Candidatus Binatia bacterium]